MDKLVWVFERCFANFSMFFELLNKALRAIYRQKHIQFSKKDRYWKAKNSLEQSRSIESPEPLGFGFVSTRLYAKFHYAPLLI
jgi:hypothetical protein